MIMLFFCPKLGLINRKRMDEIIDVYYKELYGEPSRRAKFSTREGASIQILKWNKSQTDLGITLYATIGSSNKLGNQTDTCEFFIGIIPENDSCIDAIAEAAIEGNGLSIPSFGDSITLSFPLWTDTDMKTFLFTEGEQNIPTISINDKIVKFIQLVPIFSSELEFKAKYGLKLFWDQFDALEVPYWESDRKKAF